MEKPRSLRRTRLAAVIVVVVGTAVSAGFELFGPAGRPAPLALSLLLCLSLALAWYYFVKSRLLAAGGKAGPAFEIEVGDDAGSPVDRYRQEKLKLELEREQLQHDLKTIVSTVPDIIYRLDREGRITFINDAVTRYGYEPGELIGRRIIDIVHPEDRLKAHFSMSERRTGERSTRLAEIKLLTKDSTEVPFEVTEQDFVGSPVFLVDAGGLYETGADRQMRFVGTQGVARDISERKKAEETIRLSEEKYRMLFESSPDPVLMLDLRGAIVDCNRAALDFIARPRQDLIGRKFWNLTEFDPQDVRYMQRKFLSLLRGNPVEPYVLPVRRTEGKTHWFEVFSTAVRRDDSLVGVQIISRDITERKLAEEELIGSRSMLQLVLDSVPQRIFWKDRNGVLLGANRQFAADLGLDRPDRVRGKTDYDLLPNPAQAGFFREHDRQVIESGEPIYRIVEPLETPDGRQLWLETSKMPLRDSHGRVVGVLGAYEDITQRVRDEEEREKRRLQLIQADKMISLGVLVAGVAHEINNPNNFIMMNAPILRNAWESCIPLLEKYYEQNGDFMLANIPYSEMRGHVPELFEGITDGADRINSIVKNLLDYARQDNSSLDQKVDLNEVVRIVLALLANQIKKSTDCFRVDYAAGLPMVYGNFQRIEQVVLNVLQNACQALTDRSQAVEVSTAFAGPANEVLVRVKDEGEGISPEALPHVMDPFFTTRRDRGGTGLGLSISSGIMEDHGGRFEFDSEVGRGTVVSICFPAEDNGVRSQTQEVG